MLRIAALALVLVSSAARAEEWVALRMPVEKSGDVPQILVDSASIEIFDTGIRRAKVKVDFLGRRLAVEQFGPQVLSFAFWVKSYDCEKQLTRDDSAEFHLVDDAVNAVDYSNNPKWYPAPENPAADPTIEFVCTWKTK